MKKEITYILKRTFEEILISIFKFIDFILPDLTILSPFRKIIGNILWKFGKGTRIRKGLFATNLKNLIIGKNCFINRDNLFI